MKRLIIVFLIALLLIPAIPSPSSTIATMASSAPHTEHHPSSTTPAPIALPEQIAVSTNGTINYLFTADVDNDGIADIITIENGSSERYVNVYSASGALKTSISLSYEVLNVTVADVNATSAGNELLVTYYDGSYIVLAVYSSTGSLLASNSVLKFYGNTTIVAGPHVIYVLAYNGSTLRVAGLDLSLNILGNATYNGFVSYLRLGEVSLLQLDNNTAYLAYDGSIALNSFAGVALKISAGSDYYIVRDDNAVYYLYYIRDAKGNVYLVDVYKLADYNAIGSGVGYNATSAFVSENATLYYFRYNSTDGKIYNSSYTFNATIYELFSADIDNDLTNEYVAIAADGIYEISLASTNITVTTIAAFNVTVSSYSGYSLRDIDGDGKLDIVIYGYPIVFYFSASGSVSMYFTTGNEYALGMNGLYILKSDSIELIAYSGNETIVGFDELGLDENYSHLMLVYPEGLEAAFLKAANGFIVLNGTTLLPIRYLRAPAEIRFVIEPSYLAYYYNNTLYVDTITLDHEAPAITASLNEYYNPDENLSITVFASDNVYLYGLYIDIYNASFAYHDFRPIFYFNYSATLVYNIPAIGLVPGTYNVSLRTFDGDGLKAFFNTTITIDDGEAPAIEYLGSYVYNAAIYDTLSLPFNITDDTPIEVYAIYSFNGTRKNASISLINGTYYVAVPVIAYGTLYVEVHAKDSAGNENSLAISIIVDDGKAPEITLEAPVNASVYTLAGFNVTISDVTYKNATITLVDPLGNVTLNVTITNSSYSYVFDVPIVGYRNVSVVAYDAAGHRSEAFASIYVYDDVPPKAVLVSHVTVTNVNTPVEFLFNVIDNYYKTLTVYAYANGTIAYQASVNTGSVEISITFFKPGYYVLEFEFVDGSNNSFTLSTYLIVDDGKPPEITINAPENASVYSTVTVSVSISDDTNFTAAIKVYVYNAITGNVSEISIAEGLENDSYTFTLYLNIVGNRTIRVNSVDSAGNAANATYTIRVYDLLPPEIYVEAPEGVVDVGENVTINATIVDNYYLGNVSIELNGEPIGYQIVEQTNNTLVIAIPFTPSAPDNYTFLIKAYDYFGNFNATSFYINSQDLTPPSVELSYPASVEVLTEANIEIYASDNYLVSQVSAYYSRDNANRTKLDVIKVGDHRVAKITPDRLGTLYIKVSAYDPAGHETTKSAMIVVYDDIPPKIERIEIPASIANGENLTITVYASDNYKIKSVEVYVSYDNATRTKLTVHYIDGKRIASYIPDQSGTLFVKVVVTDVAGNSSSDVRAINVRMNVPALAIGLTIITLLAILIAIIRKRR